MSNPAVDAKTGRTWAQWVKVLDGAKAHTWTHREIADHVHETYEVSGWWALTVTVGYERVKGLRDVGQRRTGTHEANKSRTVAVPLSKLSRACSDARTRAMWLPGVQHTVRKATANKAMRITWYDGSSVEVYLTAKGKDKSQVQIQHRKLPSREVADAMKTSWGERLDDLVKLLQR